MTNKPITYTIHSMEILGIGLFKRPETEVVQGPFEHITLPSNPLEAARRRLQLALKAIQYQERIIDASQITEPNIPPLTELTKQVYGDRIKIIKKLLHEGHANWTDFLPDTFFQDEPQEADLVRNVSFIHSWILIRRYAQSGERSKTKDIAELPPVSIYPKKS